MYIYIKCAGKNLCDITYDALAVYATQGQCCAELHNAVHIPFSHKNVTAKGRLQAGCLSTRTQVYLYLFLLVYIAYDIISRYRLTTLREHVTRNIILINDYRLTLVEVLAHGEILMSLLYRLLHATHKRYVFAPVLQTLTLLDTLCAIEDIVEVFLTQHYVALGYGYEELFMVLGAVQFRELVQI